MAERRIRILDHLSPPNQELCRTLPPYLVKRAEEGLSSVKRGQAKKLAPFNETFTETDLDHTISMLGIGVHEIPGKFPHITQGMNYPAAS